MNRNDFYDALYLAHHGIKGQRWGKRNGPPYPLDEEDHSPKEQNQQKGLTDGQKRAIKIGAALAVAGLATYGAYKLHQSGALSDIGIKKAASVVDVGKDVEKARTLSGEIDHPLTSKIQNALGAKMTSETDEQRLANLCTLKGEERADACVQTAFANALQKVTGLQLKPNPDLDDAGKSVKHITSDFAHNLFPKAEEHSRYFQQIPNTDLISSKEKIDAHLVKLMGNNAVGVIDTDLCYNSFGAYAGHAFNFIIKDGKVSYEDAKNHIDGNHIFGEHTKSEGRLTFFRVDNATDIDTEFLKKYVSAR